MNCLCVSGREERESRKLSLRQAATRMVSCTYTTAAAAAAAAAAAVHASPCLVITCSIHMPRKQKQMIHRLSVIHKAKAPQHRHRYPAPAPAAAAAAAAAVAVATPMLQLLQPLPLPLQFKLPTERQQQQARDSSSCPLCDCLQQHPSIIRRCSNSCCSCCSCFCRFCFAAKQLSAPKAPVYNACICGRASFYEGSPPLTPTSCSRRLLSSPRETPQGWGPPGAPGLCLCVKEENERT